MPASPAAGTTAKRAASSSVSPSKRLAKSAKSSGKADAKSDVDSYDDGIDFDAEALVEAAALAEEEDAKLRSSQASSSSQGAASRMGAGSSQTSTASATSSNTLPKSAPGAKPSDDKLFALPPDAHLLKHSDPLLEEKTMDPEWYGRMESDIKAPYFAELKGYLGRELSAGKTIYPPAHLVHSWSRLTPLRNVKVVVVGQDPYHGPGQACGHSFSVPRGVSVPGSLQNIYKELGQEYGPAFQKPGHGCLDGWAKQGVLLLNACLTVTAHQAGSHHNQGWERFTQQILRTIASDAAHGQKPSVKTSAIASMFSKAAASQSAPPAQAEEPKSGGEPAQASNGVSSDRPQSRGVVFLAWGLPAAKTLAAAGITEKSPNVLLLKSAHPSPLSAHRGFLGNGHFQKANAWLEEPGRYGPGGGIKWGEL